MSTYTFANDLLNSSPGNLKAVDADKLEGNFTKAETEWKGGANTDFNVAKVKAANINTDLGSSNRIGETGKTTYYGSIANTSGHFDYYEFPLKYCWEEDQIAELEILASGTIVEIGCKFGKADASTTDVNIAVGNYSGNSWGLSSLVKNLSGDTYTFENIGTTQVTHTSFEAGGSVTKNQRFTIEIKNAAAGIERLVVYIIVLRS